MFRASIIANNAYITGVPGAEEVLLYHRSNNNHQLKGTVSRDWIGPCIVLMDRPKLIHMSRRFSDFFMVSSCLNSNNCSGSVLSKNH